MKKMLALLMAMCCVGISGIIANAEEKIYTDEEIEKITNPGTGNPFAPYQFVFDGVNTASEFMRDNLGKVDIREAGDHLNLDNPSESYVEVTAGDEEAAEIFLNAMVEKGFNAELFHITVNPDFHIYWDVAYGYDGDINMDNKLDIKDVAIYSMCLVGLKEFPERADIDINGDGKVDINDLALLKKQLIGELLSQPDYLTYIISQTVACSSEQRRFW